MEFYYSPSFKEIVIQNVNKGGLHQSFLCWFSMYDCYLFEDSSIKLSPESLVSLDPEIEKLVRSLIDEFKDHYLKIVKIETDRGGDLKLSTWFKIAVPKKTGLPKTGYSYSHRDESDVALGQKYVKACGLIRNLTKTVYNESFLR